MPHWYSLKNFEFDCYYQVTKWMGRQALVMEQYADKHIVKFVVRSTQWVKK